MFHEDGQAAGYSALEVETIAPKPVPLAAGADLDPDRSLASVKRLEGDRADPLSALVSDAERVVEER
jgi:hypothetical protein